MKKLLYSVLVTMMLMFGFTVVNTTVNTAIASVTSYNVVDTHATSLDSVMSDIQKNGTTVMGGETKKKVSGLAREVQEIILVIVMAFLMCTGIWTATQFAGAGDDATKKGKLKTKLIFIVLGIVFIASYYGFLNFGFKNLKLF